MLSNKKIICPNNLISIAKKAGVVDAAIGIQSLAQIHFGCCILVSICFMFEFPRITATAVMSGFPMRSNPPACGRACGCLWISSGVTVVVSSFVHVGIVNTGVCFASFAWWVGRGGRWRCVLHASLDLT